MRKLLHSNSRLEARKFLNNTELQTSNLRVAPGLDNTVPQLNGGSSAHSIAEGCEIPSSVQRHSDARAKRVTREAAHSNGAQAVQSGPSDSQHLDGVNGKSNGAVRLKPGIVVIDGRAVFRDCFVRCLEISYRDHEIFSFANIGEWHGSKEPNALAAAVIIVIESGYEFDGPDYELFETAAANTPIVLVSDVDDLDHIVRTMKHGVRGYIPTNLPFNIAVEAVRLVKAGGTFVPASSFVHDRSEQQPGMKASAPLTERQLKVIEEIRHGKANKQIAYELNMSEHTVKVHLRHIMRKLRAKNRTEVAVMSEDLFARSKDQRLDSHVRPDPQPK
jgi:DNA-binding NarL/FixJ family response regulator